MTGLRDMVRPLEGRIRLMLSRAIVSLVDDARQLQELQIEMLEGERQDGAEHFQPYGFAAVAHSGAEAMVGCVGGLRSHAIVLAVSDRRFRLKNLSAGEVALYDDLGNVVKLGRDRIEITATADIVVTAAGSVTIDSGDIRLGTGSGAKVARVGDDVNLTTGKIISGSDKVTAS